MLRLPLSKLCAVPFALQLQSTFQGGEKGDKVPRKGEEEGWPAKGAKRKKGRAKTGQMNFGPLRLEPHRSSAIGQFCSILVRTYSSPTSAFVKIHMVASVWLSVPLLLISTLFLHSMNKLELFAMGHPI